MAVEQHPQRMDPVLDSGQIQLSKGGREGDYLVNEAQNDACRREEVREVIDQTRNRRGLAKASNQSRLTGKFWDEERIDGWICWVPSTLSALGAIFPIAVGRPRTKGR